MEKAQHVALGQCRNQQLLGVPPGDITMKRLIGGALNLRLSRSPNDVGSGVGLVIARATSLVTHPQGFELKVMAPHSSTLGAYHPGITGFQVYTEGL